MSTSGTYGWNPTIDDVMTDAFERCGVPPSDISSQQWTSGIFSLNAVMSELTNMQLNLWEVEPVLITLTEGVRDYLLPAGTVDALEVYRRSYDRVLGGTAATSAGGTAANAFDGILTTSCTQVSTNGNISYDYGAGNTEVITMVGYQATTAATLTLVYEGSNDASAWTALVSNLAQSYPASQIVWNIVPTPGAYRYYRVRATGGGTLNPEEVYFANNEEDYVLGRLSRQDYDAIAIKANQGIPTTFYVERVVNPILHLYLTPDDSFTMLKVNRIRQLQSVTGATQTMDAAFRFIESMTAMLARKLSVKYAPDRLMMLKQEASDSLTAAQGEDRERVRAKFAPDMSGYRIN